jgi:hypothetical protein
LAGSETTHAIVPPPEDKKESSFFEKKAAPALREPKNFYVSMRAAETNRDSQIKVFCFFSSEKKFFLALSRPGGAWAGNGFCGDQAAREAVLP